MLPTTGRALIDMTKESKMRRQDRGRGFPGSRHTRTAGIEISPSDGDRAISEQAVRLRRRHPSA
jgi:hypothetical protein